MGVFSFKNPRNGLRFKGKEDTPMLQELDFNKRSVRKFLVGVKEMFFEDVTDRSREFVKKLLEWGVQQEFEEYVEAKRYERNEARRDHRNGYRTRSLMTTWGMLEDIRVPRGRVKGFAPRVLERYRRVERRVDEGVLKMYLMGVSTRKVGDVLQSLFDFTLSASYVSKVAKQLDEEVQRFFHRPLDDEFRYLFLDGIWVKVKDVSKSVRRVILVAYGIRHNGSRQLINFWVGPSEEKEAWADFLKDLKARGLTGSKLALIISDGSTGLWGAAQAVFPFVDHQLCWVHKLRNVANYCPRKFLKECIAQARQIYLSLTVKTALKVFREWEKTWRRRCPRAVACLARDIDKLLQFLKCPVEHHRIIRTTNIIERLFKELRRRLRVMGIFSDAKSCKRITYSLVAYHNTRWIRMSCRIKEIALTHKQAA
jgi:transposase-like protein